MNFVIVCDWKVLVGIVWKNEVNFVVVSFVFVVL